MWRELVESFIVETRTELVSKTKVNGILVNKVEHLEDENDLLRKSQLALLEELDHLKAQLATLGNLQDRIHGLETKYSEQKEYKPIPTSRGSWRSIRANLERGVNAKHNPGTN